MPLNLRLRALRWPRQQRRRGGRQHRWSLQCPQWGMEAKSNTRGGAGGWAPTARRARGGACRATGQRRAVSWPPRARPATRGALGHGPRTCNCLEVAPLEPNQEQGRRRARRAPRPRGTALPSRRRCRVSPAPGCPLFPGARSVLPRDPPGLPARVLRWWRSRLRGSTRPACLPRPRQPLPPPRSRAPRAPPPHSREPRRPRRPSLRRPRPQCPR
mmetsp:Transcript_4285/g.12520  ORF Transcript_4285/g.12520 Transcript_4285/m.12520 type:complete len:215 (-) Transcript_4285:377-1021(-)